MFAIGVIMEDMWYCLVNWALITMFICGCSVFSVAYSCAVMLAHDFHRYFIICGSLGVPMAW